MTPHPALASKLAAALARVRAHGHTGEVGGTGRMAGKPGDDLDSVLEALALCAVAGVVGGLAELPAKERRTVVAAGARILLAARAAAGDDDSLHVAVALAADGLDALRGDADGRADRHEGVRRKSVSRSTLHPSPAALVAMTRGDPDALAAALVAAHTRHCPLCRESLSVSAPLGEPAARDRSAPLLRVAAATSTVRSPADGRRVARLTTPPVEAVLFDDGGTRRLAVYGDAHVSLRLVADGVSTEDQLPGYWLGRVAGGVKRVDAVLHVGDTQVAWKLSLR